MQLIQSLGATGWRTAHNPVNSELLDFADELGMLMCVACGARYLRDTTADVPLTHARD